MGQFKVYHLGDKGSSRPVFQFGHEEFIWQALGDLEIRTVESEFPKDITPEARASEPVVILEQRYNSLMANFLTPFKQQRVIFYVNETQRALLMESINNYCEGLVERKDFKH